MDNNCYISPISVDETDKKDFCNSNNHKLEQLPSYADKRIDIPYNTLEEYRGYQERFNYSVFSHILTKNASDRLKIKFTQADILNLYRICRANTCDNISLLSSLCNEVITNLVEQIVSQIPKERFQLTFESKDDSNIQDIQLKDKYFVRLDYCSPKDSRLYKSGIGPFTKITDIIYSIISSQRCFHCIAGLVARMSNNKSRDTYLWLLKWDDSIKTENEFRCFVLNDKITAMSQYRWFENFNWFDDPKKKNLLIPIVNKAQELIDNCIKGKVGKDMKHYVMDIHIVAIDDYDDCEVELIELNPFGAMYGSGTCLFHWIRDYDQLYGISRKQDKGKHKIEIRVIGTTSKPKSLNDGWHAVFTF